MTTTEWVERYNQVFDWAGRWDRRIRELNPWSVEAKFNSMFPSNEAMAELMYNNPYKAIPPNPSPFEPKEVVDDGQEGIGALNRKE